MDLWVYAPSLIGGILIGVSASMMLLGSSRVAGISGITASVVTGERLEGWRASFLVGLIGTGALVAAWMPELFANGLQRSMGALVVAGLLVGVGTRLGSGCTSGHGVCGLSRRSPRSLAAVLTFMAVGAITATLVRVVFGGVI